MLVYFWLSLVSVTHGQLRPENIKWKIPEIVHKFWCMLLWVVWWNPVLSAASTWDLVHPFVLLSCPLVTCGISIISSTIFVLMSPLYYLKMAHKCKSSDACSLDIPQKSYQVFSLIKMVKVFCLMRKNTCLLKLLRCMVRMNLLWNYEEKEMCACFCCCASNCKSYSCRDFPGGPVIKNLTCNAGNVCLIPDWGTKILHAAEQLSPCATVTEPEPVHHNWRAHL